MPLHFPADLTGLTVWRSGNRYQASLRVEGNEGWRVEHGATVDEALTALFAPVPCDLVPPPCPVPAA